LVSLQGGRDAELRNAVQEIGRAVERIDNPGMRLVRAGPLAPFLAEKAIARSGLDQLFVQDFFGPAVGGADEIGRPFHGDLQVLDLAEIPLERAARASHGLDHHIEESGAEHRTCSFEFSRHRPRKRRIQ
jgi:hypothetical protein